MQDFEATRLNLVERREIIDYLTTNPNSPYFVPIDPVVTGDIARLIRLPGSLYVREGHIGICRLIDIPGIELVDNALPITLSSFSECQPMVSRAQVSEAL